MKLKLVTAAAVVFCLCSLAARSSALRAVALIAPERACQIQERIALATIDGHLRSKMPRLARR
jgi:hypothetical protein